MKWADARKQLLENTKVREAYAQEAPLTIVGARVAVRRHQLGLTQTELANRAKVTQGQVSSLEHGKANVTLRTFTRVLRALDLVLEMPARRVRVGFDDERVRAAITVAATTASFSLPADMIALSSTAAGVPTRAVHSERWDRRAAV